MPYPSKLYMNHAKLDQTFHWPNWLGKSRATFQFHWTKIYGTLGTFELTIKKNVNHFCDVTMSLASLYWHTKFQCKNEIKKQLLAQILFKKFWFCD